MSLEADDRDNIPLSPDLTHQRFVQQRTIGKHGENDVWHFARNHEELIGLRHWLTARKQHDPDTELVPLPHDTQEFSGRHLGLLLPLLSLSVAASARQVAPTSHTEDHEWRHMHSLFRKLGATALRHTLGALHPHEKRSDVRIPQGDTHGIGEQRLDCVVEKVGVPNCLTHFILLGTHSARSGDSDSIPNADDRPSCFPIIPATTFFSTIKPAPVFCVYCSGASHDDVWRKLCLLP